MKNLFTYIWEFEVPATADAEFQRHYGPGGTWVALFRCDPGYIETLLLKDASKPERYITIDRWHSAQAYQAFRERFTEQYATLDKLCENLTTRETYLGSFSELSNKSVV